MEEAIEFINEKLFTEEKPVLFTDLIHKFHIGPSRAKKTMYAYYRSNKTLKYNCIIVCCYKDRIKVVHDVNHVDSQESLIDCFIYAFNPMEEFIPVNLAVDQREYLSILNPHKLVLPELRSKTVEEETTIKAVPKPSARSKTVPQTTKDEKPKPVPPKKQQQPAKSKDGALKSTALLAKMRADREAKEAQRQKELAQRREKELQEKKSKNDAQMKELNQMFVDDSDEDDGNDDNQRQESEKPTSTVEPDELEEILDSTAEESLLKQSQSQDEQPKVKQEPQDTSYVDEDGYIVTNRPANNSSTSTPSQSRKRPGNSTPISHQQAKKPAPRKKTQGTLESFFKKSK
ncbi:ZYRO0E02948p [Zygosaccharomyces rouxii]|uniref:ZYRO0E02948p n=1 Tax=Zygosaccharomyces rouxii (strain ATCC 2623 / CBS 732 / NBRC 1130 / NCYC 568 / NRRL Y-229) TaxID=559307 RepID=C5E453_ZYGRC|nr:uncharacterized protein ZYRO0E02948g [Zygosaccharomyces rouxii]KAH9198327.1 hypothetical protein LQ764DRAFT_157604 [Zygosaccharomyces rouxii]CAR30814.1 ZYRO0E02948p [Zygosaccharomyces rouxii]